MKFLLGKIIRTNISLWIQTRYVIRCFVVVVFQFSYLKIQLLFIKNDFKFLVLAHIYVYVILKKVFYTDVLLLRNTVILLKIREGICGKLGPLNQVAQYEELNARLNDV